MSEAKSDSTVLLSSCPDCNVIPRAMMVPTFFTGPGYMYECNCGLGIPFPAATSQEKAAEAWNEHVKERLAGYPNGKF